MCSVSPHIAQSQSNAICREKACDFTSDKLLTLSVFISVLCKTVLYLRRAEGLCLQH